MPEGGYLTIGKVVARLQPSYPDLTVSKVRFLEDEGIVSPSRSPSGYRLFSPGDVRRLERALYLQKTRFLPLSVIKEELDRPEQARDGQGGAPQAGVEPAPAHMAAGGLGDPVEREGLRLELPEDPDEVVGRLYPIDRMPEVAGVPVSFVRQLGEAGIVSFKRSPHGRDLVDGHDLQVIRICDELRHFGFEPKNLRQYVMTANRESATFEQALVVYARKGGGVEMERTQESRERFDDAFDRMLGLTGALRNILVKRRVQNPFEGVGEEDGGGQHG